MYKWNSSYSITSTRLLLSVFCPHFNKRVILMWKIKVPSFVCYILLKHTTANALNPRIELKSKFNERQKEGTVVSYCETINQFVEMYATEDLTAETGTDMMRLAQLSNKLHAEFRQALLNKMLRFNRLHDEYYSRNFYWRIFGFYLR